MKPGNLIKSCFYFRFDEGEWVDIQSRGQFGNPADFFARDMAVYVYLFASHASTSSSPSSLSLSNNNVVMIMMIRYVHGFGDPAAEFWLGLDKLKQLTRF